MAKRGDVFTLHDGEKVTVRMAAADSGGELLEVEAEWTPVPNEPPLHYHPLQSEQFEIHEGELTVEIEGTKHVARAGETVAVPKGAVHKMWASGETTTRASWQVRPALRTEDFFASVDAVRSSGRHGEGGMLTPLGAGVVLNAFHDEFRMAIPAPLQRPLLGALVALARLRGYPAVG